MNVVDGSDWKVFIETFLLIECLVSLLTRVINVQLLVDDIFVVRSDERDLTLEQV